MPVTVVVRSGARGTSPPPSITLDVPIVVIGRGEGCDVRLPDPSVSSRHASIRQRGSEWIVIDEGSTNGTYLGAVRLGPRAPRIVRHGEVVRVGRVFLEIRFDVPVGTAQPVAATRELALALVARAMEAQGEHGGPRLLVADGPDRGRFLDLAEAGRPYAIGRGKECDLALEEPSASRRHVQVVRRGDQLLARDLGSKNGSSLAGAPLETGRDMPWKIGEELRIGADAFVYEHPAVDALAELGRMADEAVAAADVASPEPSETPAASSEAGTPDAGAADDAQITAGDRADAPVARVPAGAPPLARKKKSGWGHADLLIVVLALAVLGMSVIGLAWLLRG